MPARRDAAEPKLVKMSVLARLSGVPAPTIKHYIREGLLPQPEVRSSKNMALYDASVVERVKAIKELQRTKFLPLKVIKGILDGVQPDTDEETAQAIRRALDDIEPAEARTREQLIKSGASEEDLGLLRLLGLLSPKIEGGTEIYSGDDLKLLRVLAEARRAGITAQMLPPSILEPYAQAIRELVRTELKLFREGVIPLARGNLGVITETATRLSEQLVLILRRKLLLPTLRQLAAPPEQAPAPLAAAPSEQAPSAPRARRPEAAGERERKPRAPRRSGG